MTVKSYPRKRHYLYKASGGTACGIMVQRLSDGTYQRRGWGGGPVVLASSNPMDVDCQRCRRIEGLPFIRKGEEAACLKSNPIPTSTPKSND
jgi:hypothetical protein